MLDKVIRAAAVAPSDAPPTPPDRAALRRAQSWDLDVGGEGVSMARCGPGASVVRPAKPGGPPPPHARHLERAGAGAGQAAGGEGLAAPLLDGDGGGGGGGGLGGS